MVGQYVKDSILVNNTFNAKFINLSTSKIIGEIGKNPLLKISRYLIILFKIFFNLIKFNPQVVYLAITAKGIGFYKDFPIVVLSKIFGKKLVLHYHNKGVSVNQNKFFNNLLYNILFKNTIVILLSERLYSDVSKYVKKENVYFCPNGIPDINNLESYKKINANTKILFFSNLIESKGVFILLEALKLLKDDKVQFHCNLVGGEGDITSKEINKKINTLKLDENVKYLGSQYGNHKKNIFKSSDIFVFPSFYHNECFPIVLIEAMMFELPVISTDEGGISDIIKNGYTGFIVDKKIQYR